MKKSPVQAADNPRLVPLAGATERAFALDLTQANMEALTRQHWGAWRSDVLATHFDRWDNVLIHGAGQPVGYVGVEVRGETLLLHNLQIQAIHRGQSLGRWALRELVARPGFRGCKYLEARIFKDNPAISFFRRQGFGVSGEDAHCLTMRGPIHD